MVNETCDNHDVWEQNSVHISLNRHHTISSTIIDYDSILSATKWDLVASSGGISKIQ